MDRDQVQPAIYAQTRNLLGYHIAQHLFGSDASTLLAEAGGDAHWRLITLEATLAIERGDTALLPPGQTWSQALTEYAFDDFTVTGLSVNRYIFDPSDWTRSRWIAPLGASGHPASPHYADQAQLWADVEFIPQLWDWQEIRDQAETTQHLVPPEE